MNKNAKRKEVKRRTKKKNERRILHVRVHALHLQDQASVCNGNKREQETPLPFLYKEKMKKKKKKPPTKTDKKE